MITNKEVDDGNDDDDDDGDDSSDDDDDLAYLIVAKEAGLPCDWPSK